jgi:hypothetical protein
VRNEKRPESISEGFNWISLLLLRLRMFLHALTLLLTLEAHAEERIRVHVPSEAERQVQDLLERLATSVQTEDHKAFTACFTKTAKAKYCEQAALDFVSHDMDMDVGKWVLTDESDDAASLVVKYTMNRDGVGTEYISKVRAVRDGSMFVVDREEIQTSRLVREGGVVLAAGGECPDGRCPLPKQPQRQQRVIPALFNDANGNPDPNGIMWLDPNKLLGEECAPCNRRAK